MKINTYQKIIIFLFTCVLMVHANAQQTYETAENFTLTDLEGNEHTLYDYLDQDKTVFIKLFATWCSACWSHHQQGYLKQLWETRGPDGADDVMILSIENDINTEESWIYNEINSFGDWTADTPYPIINTTTAEEADIFDVSAYPEFIIIKPNRVMEYFDDVHFVGHYETIVDAALPPATQNSEVAILDYSGSTSYCNEITPELTIQNLGFDTITSAEVEVLDENNEYLTSYVWEGELATYDIATVSFPAFEFDESAGNISFSFYDTAESDYNKIQTTFERPTTQSDTLNFDIQTDNFGFETYWAILNENGETVAEGGNTEVGLNGGGLQSVVSGGYESNTLFNEQLILEAGQCYTLVVIDDYADGICCNNGAGYFRLSTPNGELLHINDGGFGEQFELIFKIENTAETPTEEETTEEETTEEETPIEEETTEEETQENEEETNEVEVVLMASFDYIVDGYTLTIINNSTGTDIDNYTWSFGDGYYDFSVQPAPHTYGGAGVYPISLYINNGSGSAYISENIIIEAPTNTNFITFNNHFYIYQDNDKLLVNFTTYTSEKVIVKVYDMRGQLLTKKVESTNLGDNEISIITNNFGAGMYIVQLEKNGNLVAKRFVVSQ